MNFLGFFLKKKKIEMLEKKKYQETYRTFDILVIKSITSFIEWRYLLLQDILSDDP